VHRIVGTSQVCNRRSDITGLLAFSGRHFAQVVEGAAADVDLLVDRIARDPRHHAMKILQRLEGVRSRSFGTWAMHLLDSMSHAEEIEVLFDESTATAKHAVQLLEAITAEARWRNADDMLPVPQPTPEPVG
jgi:hypothetical protein